MSVTQLINYYEHVSYLIIILTISRAVPAVPAQDANCILPFKSLKLLPGIQIATILIEFSFFQTIEFEFVTFQPRNYARKWNGI